MNDNSSSLAAEMPDEEQSRVFHRIWFKVYNDDLLADPRIACLDDTEFRHYMGLLVIANNDLHPGEIHLKTSKLAKMLRTSEPRLLKSIDALVADGILFAEDDVIYICNSKRHYSGKGLNWSDSPEAQAQRKENQRQRDRNSDVTVTVEERDEGVGFPNQKEKENENQNRNQHEIVEEDQSTLPGRDNVGVRSSVVVSQGKEDRIYSTAADDKEDMVSQMETYLASVVDATDFTPSVDPLRCLVE